MSYESIKSAAREAAKGSEQVREAVRLGFEMKRDLEAKQKRQQEEREKHQAPPPAQTQPVEAQGEPVAVPKGYEVRPVKCGGCGAPSTEFCRRDGGSDCYREFHGEGTREPWANAAPQPAVAGGDGWMPIETAPKDGTVIDLWHDEFERYADCYWGLPQHCCGEDGRYCDSEWHSAKEGWVMSILNELLEGEHFTHWRPLPAPPAALHGSEKGE